jgi:hypothetical protein
MILEIREVSRKTPRDGRLEISGETARRLGALAPPLPLLVGEASGAAELEAMECTCGKGAATPGGAPHRHHFVRSPLFMQLTEGESVVLELDAGDRLHVARPHALRPS